MQGDLATARLRIRVVLPMGLAVLAVGLLGAWVEEGQDPLDLQPYLSGPVAAGLLVQDSAPEPVRRAVLTMGPLPRGLLAAGVALLLFVVLEGVVRRTWDHPNEVAALLPATLFAVLPSQMAFQRVAGGVTLLAGLLTLLLGCWLAMSRRRAAAVVGAGFAGLAAAVHPAMVVLVPAVIPCLWLAGGRKGFGAVVGVSAVVTGGVLCVFVGGTLAAPAISETVALERSHWALELLGAAPALALWAHPRDLLPTGFEALRGDIWPVAVGAAAWALLVAWAMLTTGIVRSAVVAGLAALAGAAPFVVPAWIPGDRAVALLPVLFGLVLLAQTLSVIRGPRARDVGILVCLAIAGIGLWSSRGTHGGLETRRHAFMPENATLGFVPVLEEDAARLVLFGLDVLEQEREEYEAGRPRGRLPSWRVAAGGVAKQKLLVQGPPVLDKGRLQKLASRLRVAIDAQPDGPEAELLDKLDGLDLTIIELTRERRSSLPEEWYASVQVRLQELVPDAQEVLYALRDGSVRHPRFHKFRYSFNVLVRECALWATAVGDLHYSVPLREVLVELTQGQERNHSRARAILGLELLEMKRLEEAKEHLQAAVEQLPRNDVLGAVVKGALATTLIAEGDKAQALTELSEAWSGLSAGVVGGEGMLRLAQPASRDYWLLSELLLLRYELAKDLDPGLREQALRDVLVALEPALDLGVRRVPALAFWGRLKYLQGDVKAARSILLEMRRLRPASFGERGSGARGLFDVPRFRLAGLRTLTEVLDPAADASLLQAIEQEIRALDRY
ncbi:MAG: hypothetical protein VX913_14325 [Planctomycetota bacterium]|nr:hypothetical protein [Planctomycetota bacterium]